MIKKLIPSKEDVEYNLQLGAKYFLYTLAYSLTKSFSGLSWVINLTHDKLEEATNKLKPRKVTEKSDSPPEEIGEKVTEVEEKEDEEVPQPDIKGDHNSENQLQVVDLSEKAS